MIPDAEKLLKHLGHEIRVVRYGDEDDAYSVSIECETCCESLFELVGVLFEEEPESPVLGVIGDHADDEESKLNFVESYEEFLEVFGEPPGPVVLSCEGCGWEGRRDEVIPLEVVPNLSSRLVPGGVVPYGACPRCDVLVYHLPQIP